jgi:hypothetical protein
VKLTNNKLLLKPKLDEENIAGIIKKLKKEQKNSLKLMKMKNLE